MVMRNTITIVAGAALCAFGSMVFGLEEMKISQELAPMEKPALLKIGDEWHALHKGAVSVEKVVAIDGERVTWERSDGCSWTSIQYQFAPSVEWAGRASELLALLDDAGLHHNAEGSRKVLEDLLALP